jgi:hypothetical protein
MPSIPPNEWLMRRIWPTDPLVARNLLAAGSSVSSVARSMGVSRASVHRAPERAGGKDGGGD